MNTKATRQATERKDIEKVFATKTQSTCSGFIAAWATWRLAHFGAWQPESLQHLAHGEPDL